LTLSDARALLTERHFVCDALLTVDALLALALAELQAEVQAETGGEAAVDKGFSKIGEERALPNPLPESFVEQTCPGTMRLQQGIGKQWPKDRPHDRSQDWMRLERRVKSAQRKIRFYTAWSVADSLAAPSSTSSSALSDAGLGVSDAELLLASLSVGQFVCDRLGLLREGEQHARNARTTGIGVWDIPE
jgi:hypothetical protein